jgi:Smg protein
MIIERAMALEGEVVGLEKFKVIALMVLWTRRGSVDTLILDELLPDGEKRQMH